MHENSFLDENLLRCINFLVNISDSVHLEFFLSNNHIIHKEKLLQVYKFIDYIAPILINFADKNFNTKEYTNNSKKILAYTPGIDFPDQI